MYYAVFLLYQRANIAKRAEWWRKESYEMLETVTGARLSEADKGREQKAVPYASVSEDEATDFLYWFGK